MSMEFIGEFVDSLVGPQKVFLRDPYDYHEQQEIRSWREASEALVNIFLGDEGTWWHCTEDCKLLMLPSCLARWVADMQSPAFNLNRSFDFYNFLLKSGVLLDRRLSPVLPYVVDIACIGVTSWRDNRASADAEQDSQDNSFCDVLSWAFILPSIQKLWVAWWCASSAPGPRDVLRVAYAFFGAPEGAFVDTRFISYNRVVSEGNECSWPLETIAFISNVQTWIDCRERLRESDLLRSRSGPSVDAFLSDSPLWAEFRSEFAHRSFVFAELASRGIEFSSWQDAESLLAERFPNS